MADSQAEQSIGNNNLEATTPASAEEIKKYGEVDSNEAVVELAGKKDYKGWEQHPSGVYHWDAQRRIYNNDEKAVLRNALAPDHMNDSRIPSTVTFLDPAAEEKHFEENETDIEIWKWDGLQLVTQKNPLTDPSQGIHMVLKLRPEPYTVWDNSQQAMEALAVGVCVARLFSASKVLGEIGDAYLDFNANWSMLNKADLPEKGLSPDEIKAKIQENTRAHLHIQLEKLSAQWELPPAPGTFTGNKLQPEKTIEDMRTILNDDKTGLHHWLEANGLKKSAEPSQPQNPTLNS